MSRDRGSQRRDVLPDEKYGSKVITKFINTMMYDGKKSVARSIMYGVLDRLAEKTGEDPRVVFEKALDNVKPVVEVKSRRVGGATYQVPIEVPEYRRNALAMRWLITFSRKRSEKTMTLKLSNELLDAYNSTGTSFKRKEDTHKMAEANKAFSHFRW